MAFRRLLKKMDIAPQCLSNMLSSEEAPRLDTLIAILTALGCRLTIKPIETENVRAEPSAEETVTTPIESAKPRLEVTTEHGDIH